MPDYVYVNVMPVILMNGCGLSRVLQYALKEIAELLAMRDHITPCSPCVRGVINGAYCPSYQYNDY